MARRRRHALQALTFFLVAAVAGVLSAQLITSPEDRAAATAPPAPAQLTAPVEQRVLESVITARGQVRSEGLVEVAPVAAYQAEVVTLTRRDVRRGDKVRPGSAPIEVSGRPVIVLEGELPPYRTLRRDDQGRDVAQLQRALRELGHGTAPDADGTFGKPTGRALRALYADVGYAPAEEDGRVMLPMSEVAYVPSFPARIESVDGRVGGELEAPTMVISFGSLKVTADVRPSDAALLEQGQQVEIQDEVAGRERRGTVGEVGRQQASDDGSVSVPVEVEPRKQLPNSWNGADVLLRIAAPLTEDAVLVVPISAVTTRADGATTVALVAKGLAPEDVVVEAGASAAGFVAVTSADERLVAGAEVVIGNG